MSIKELENRFYEELVEETKIGEITNPVECEFLCAILTKMQSRVTEQLESDMVMPAPMKGALMARSGAYSRLMADLTEKGAQLLFKNYEDTGEIPKV